MLIFLSLVKLASQIALLFPYPLFPYVIYSKYKNYSTKTESGTPPNFFTRSPPKVANHLQADSRTTDFYL